MRASSKSRSLDAVLLAMADPTRRAILRRLARSEVRVTDVAAPFRMSLNSVSKHIRILERAGLVERRKAGREHLLRFRPEPLDKVRTWIARQEAFWRAGLVALDMLFNEESGKESR